MTKKRYAHITQDALGVISKGASDAWSGIVTDGVESCVVYVFECEDGVAMCHDSGQMKLDELVSAVSSLGAVERVKVIKSAVQRDPRQGPLHAKRQLELFQQLKVSQLDVEPQSSPRGTFVAVYDVAGSRLRDAGGLPGETLSPPDIAYRAVVAKVNNNFMSPNAQDLQADVQFRDDDYLPTKAPRLSLDEVLANIESEPDYFFMNFAVLLEAHQAKVFELPQPIIALAQAIRMKPGDWSWAVGDPLASHQLFVHQIPRR